MLTIEALIAVLGLVLSAIALGYAMGCNHSNNNSETQK